MNPSDMKKLEKIAILIAAFILLFILLISLCSCQFALIHKDDIGTFHKDFKVYRKYVIPTEEPEKVNQLGDNLEKTLEGWEGDWDAK